MEFLYVINPAREPEAVPVPDLDRRDVAMPELPEVFYLRRGFGVSAQEFGPMSAAEVAQGLAEGTLAPDDYYRAANGQWQRLETTGLG